MRSSCQEEGETRVTLFVVVVVVAVERERDW